MIRLYAIVFVATILALGLGYGAESVFIEINEWRVR